MAKKKTGQREARKERALAAKEAKLAAQEAAHQTRRRWRTGAIVVALVSVAFAAIAYWGLEDQRLVGISLLLGGVLVLLLGLGSLGAGVKPRDRGSAGSIDFGKRN